MSVSIISTTITSIGAGRFSLCVPKVWNSA